MRADGRRSTFVAIYTAAFIVGVAYGASYALLAVRLEALGVSGALIGINAAMPAIGWLLGSLLQPRLQSLFGIKRVALGFILIGVVAFLAMMVLGDYWSSTGLRFLFGGGVGMFLRSLEYWINGITSDETRGRAFGRYSTIYVLGLVAGSLLQPALGVEGWGAFGPLALIFLAAGAALAFGGTLVPANDSAMEARFAPAFLLIAPSAFLAIFAYGLYEDIAVYLMPIYALKNGLSEDIAAYTLTAAMLGNVVFPMPIATLSDRVGRLAPVLACAAVVVVLSLLIPFTLTQPMLFLAAIFVWAGCAGSTYALALAMLGDKFDGASLISANATFGVVYATGQLIGPLMNGPALDRLHSNGALVSAAMIFGTLSMLLLVLRRRQAGVGAP